MKLNVGRVVIPILPIIKAIPPALRAAAKELEAATDADSPAGEKVSKDEVANVLMSFASTLLERIEPAVLKANGLSV